MGNIHEIFEKIFEPYRNKLKYKCDNCKEMVVEVNEYIGRANGRVYHEFLCELCYEKKVNEG